MGRQLYMSDLCRIVESVPGLRLASHAHKVVRDARYSVPSVGVYFMDRFIKKVDRGFMDERPRQEDWMTGDEMPFSMNRRYAEAYSREAWPIALRIIEDKLPDNRKPLFRAAAEKRGYPYWRM